MEYNNNRWSGPNCDKIPLGRKSLGCPLKWWSLDERRKKEEILNLILYWSQSQTISYKKVWQKQTLLIMKVFFNLSFQCSFLLSVLVQCLSQNIQLFFFLSSYSNPNWTVYKISLFINHIRPKSDESVPFSDSLSILHLRKLLDGCRRPFNRSILMCATCH